jgi:hypothetical protein
MGEVHRVRDDRLNRTVAIKILGEGKLLGFSISHLRFAIQDAFFSIRLGIARAGAIEVSAVTVSVET